MSERTPEEKRQSEQFGDDELGDGLNAAFGSEAHAASILRALDARPLHLPGSEPLPAGAATGRYQLVGELARGGMGVVYKGRDVDLGRDVAMKVLRASYKDNAEATERFMEEAQIGGQLQHPGIVPVYELGLDDEDQPYFSMKLVKGETLAALLKEGETDRRRLLTIFEQVCQTMAYAHARGVVHRDLKPANIMIGAFGEVQVVDWGFAKVLGQGGITDERPRPDVSIIATVRSSGEGSDSIDGSVMGTPAYMPPEQAFGQVEALDERSDVFALGAILYELLTGKPLYARDGDNLLVQAARCDLAQAFERLENEALEPLLRACLAASQSARPKNAASVADAIAAHLAAVDDRAREAEVAEAEAQVHADGERRKRRLTLVLGAALLAVVVIAGFTWYSLGARERERAETLHGEARQAHVEAVRLRAEGEHAKAQAEVRRSLDIAFTPAAAAFEEQIRVEREAEERAEAQGARDRVLLKTLTRIRSSLGDEVPDEQEAQALDERFTKAFAVYGVSPTDVEGLLAGSAEMMVSVAGALTEWAALRRGPLHLGRDAWRPLLDTASEIDQDERRVRYRDAFRERAHGELKAIAAVLEASEYEPATIDLLAVLLHQSGARDEAVDLLSRGQAAHLGDYFINLRLGILHPKSELGARYLTAAVALHPDIPEAKEQRARRLAH